MARPRRHTSPIRPPWAGRVLPPYGPPPSPANDRDPPGRRRRWGGFQGGRWGRAAWLALLLALALIALKLFFTFRV